MGIQYPNFCPDCYYCYYTTNSTAFSLDMRWGMEGCSAG